MKWFFPLFSLYICAQYNAAFAIYWMAANVIQIVQQVCVNAYFNRLDRTAAAQEENTEIVTAFTEDMRVEHIMCDTLEELCK